MGPGDLNKAICDLPQMSDPNLIRGLSSPDDAGVYRLSDDLAIIQTIDFFTPIVDDPYTFGQIAVANSLSDVYAMGGKPLTAMNVVCFPVKSLDISVLKEILRGGVDKMIEAGVLLVGGHSVEDNDLKYGLSVTGTVHPKRLVANSGARPGDRLILTKPLGTGIISTAVKAGKAPEEVAALVAKSMATLNKEASALMQQAGVHAGTDVTGFGLIGHTSEVAVNSEVGIKLFSSKVPLFPEVERLAEHGLRPGGLKRNRDFYAASVEISRDVPSPRQDILFDPQTSGGLLISLPAAKADVLLDNLNQVGIREAAIIGEVVSEPKGIITVS
jgi:selenide,water dikinase